MRSAHYVSNFFSFSRGSDIFCMENMTQALNFLKGGNSWTIHYKLPFAYIIILLHVLYLTSRGHPIDQEAIFILSNTLKPRATHFVGFAFIVCDHFSQILVSFTAVCMSLLFVVVTIKSYAYALLNVVTVG